ncbi:hypothetical protein D3C85_1622640 [compost metagenome]
MAAAAGIVFAGLFFIPEQIHNPVVERVHHGQGLNQQEPLLPGKTVYHCLSHYFIPLRLSP